LHRPLLTPPPASANPQLRGQVLTTPSYAAAAARIGAAARLQAELRPPLEMAVQEIEMAMVHRDYGRWRPYSIIADPAVRGPDEL
jgi:hypothetical protein